MSSFRVRPRFEQTIALSLDETRDLILNSLAQKSPGVEVKAFPGYIGVHILERDQHFWSPRLALSLEATSARSTRVQATYGPSAEVWSLFIFGYLIVGSLGVFSGILGFAQFATQTYPWGLWILGASLVLAASLYLGAQLGQKLGAWQTFLLHQAYQTAVGQPTEIT